MAHIPALNANLATNFKAATYNAVKVQVNDPKTNIMEGYKGVPDDNGVYNSVSIEVNRPSVEAGKKHCNHDHTYDYKCSDCVVTSDMAPIYTFENLPVVPVAYQTTSYISNNSLPFEDVSNDSVEDVSNDSAEVAPSEILVVEELVAVPAPNLTTVDEENISAEEKKTENLVFKGKSDIEIVPPVEIKPDVDISAVVDNLSSENFDIQAKQMEEIAKVSMENPQKAIPYIVTEVFNELIDIVKTDSSNLTPPSEEQIELRQHIIINEIVKEQASIKGENLDKLELPYQISAEDYKKAFILSSMEQAERNKEYALYTMAILGKVYGDEVQKISGNVVPLTELPGLSAIVETLKNDDNPGVKIAAVDALRYLNRPEYKEEIVSLLTLMAKDADPQVVNNVAFALESM